jgi:hypothetical protein
LDETDKVREIVSELWTRQWVCPNCGRPFPNRNQSHSCVPHALRAFLERRPPNAVALYRRFAQLVRECGPVVIIPTKMRIGFQSQVMFASVDRLTAEGMQVHVVLPRVLAHPRFDKIRSVSPVTHAHYFRIRSAEELDEEVAAWLKEAYSVGDHPVHVAPPQRRKETRRVTRSRRPMRR